LGVSIQRQPPEEGIVAEGFGGEQLPETVGDNATIVLDRSRTNLVPRIHSDRTALNGRGELVAPHGFPFDGAQELGMTEGVVVNELDRIQVGYQRGVKSPVLSMMNNPPRQLVGKEGVRGVFMRDV